MSSPAFYVSYPVYGVGHSVIAVDVMSECLRFSAQNRCVASLYIFHGLYVTRSCGSGLALHCADDHNCLQVEKKQEWT